jgi:hypothetical protein
MDAHIPSLDRKRDEVWRLSVVHLDRAVEAARERRRHELVDLALRSPPREAACDEDRRALRGNARPLELVDRDGERGCARLDPCSWNRLRRRLDHDCCAPAAWHEALERLARERKAQRVANRAGDVGHGVARRRRGKYDGVVGGVDDGDPRAGEEGNARQGSARYSRRNVRLKPRFGQNRDASRFVIRQSVVIVG